MDSERDTFYEVFIVYRGILKIELHKIQGNIHKKY